MDFSTLTAADAALFVLLNLGLFISTVLVLLMQPGFQLLEVGSVSRRNALNDAFKNVLDLCLGGLTFWLIGYTIFTADGFAATAFVEAGLMRPDALDAAEITATPGMIFLFHLAFAATSATICGGAVTGRIWPGAFLAFVMIYVGFIYPLIAFLVWHPAAPLYGVFHDFAGGVVVHASGAAAGLAGTLLLRPRMGYNGYDPLNLGRERLFRIAARHAPHNVPMAALGVFLLWIGWYGFNGGTLLANGFAPAGADGVSALGAVAEKLGDITLATTLAPLAAAVATTLARWAHREDLMLLDTMNSVIAGLVAVTAGADVFTPTQAALVGAGAAFVYREVRIALVRLNIDDPVSAISAHGLTGVYGAAAVGATASDGVAGAVLTQFGIASALVIGAFVASLAAFKIVEGAMSAAGVGQDRDASTEASISRLRIDAQIEIQGIDDELHGQDAYSFEPKSF